MISRRCWTALLAVFVFATAAMAVNVRDSIEEGAKDHGPGIQAAMESLVDSSGGWINKSGGVVDFDGSFVVKTPITIPCGNIHLRGTASGWGQFKSCWIRWIGEGPMFIFPSDAKRYNGFKMSGMLLYGNKKSTAVKIHTGDVFSRDFTFERVGARGWNKVLEIADAPGGTSRIGNLKFRDCTWSGNNQLIDAREGWINMLTVDGCEWRQNPTPEGEYLIDLHRPTCIRLRDSCFEGQRDFLRITDGDTIIFDGIYLEGQRGVVMRISGTNQVDMGPVYYRVIGADKGGKEKFHLIDCNNIRWFGERKWFRFDNCTNVTPNPTVR